MRRKKSKHGREISKRKIIQTLFILMFLVSSIYLIYYFCKSNKEIEENKNILDDIQINEEDVTEERTERMLKLAELQKQNEEIIGWLEIEGTSINYPVLQTTDNDYYLTHNYKKENSIAGSLFLDKDFDLDKPSTNYLIYGHRNKQGLMFEELIKYGKEDFYKEHPTIKFTTLKEDATYEIIAVFYSRVYYKNEKDVFRYYYFVNAENEKEYNNYIENCKKASIYDTGITAVYGEQLITLSTCEYSQENGRFAVVAKKK